MALVVGFMFISLAGFSNDVLSTAQGKAVYSCNRSLKPAPHFSIAEKGDHYVVKMQSYLRNKHTAGQPHNPDPQFLFTNFGLKDSSDVFSVEFPLKKESCKFEKNGTLFACQEGFSWITVDPAKAPIQARVVQIDGKDSQGHLAYSNQTLYLNYINLKMRRDTNQESLEFETGNVKSQSPFISHHLDVDFTGIHQPFKSYGVFISTIDYTERDCRTLN